MAKAKKKAPKSKKQKGNGDDPLGEFDLTGGGGAEEPAADPEPAEVPEAAGGGGEGDYDTEITLDRLKKATERKGSGGGGRFIFFNKDGQRAELRFLDNLLGGKSVWQHEDYNKKIKPTTCLKHYDEACEMCDKGVNKSEFFLWNVIDMSDGKNKWKNTPKILKLKGSGAGAGAISQLSSYYREHKFEIRTTNFAVSQEGDGQKKKINATSVERPEHEGKIRQLMKAFMDKRHDLVAAAKPRGSSDDDSSGDLPQSFELGD